MYCCAIQRRREISGKGTSAFFPLPLTAPDSEDREGERSLFPLPRPICLILLRRRKSRTEGKEGGAVCRRRERANVRTDRQTQSQPPPPPQQTDGEKRKSLAAGRRRRAGRGRRGNRLFEYFLFFSVRWKKKGKVEWAQWDIVPLFVYSRAKPPLLAEGRRRRISLRDGDESKEEKDCISLSFSPLSACVHGCALKGR